MAKIYGLFGSMTGKLADTVMVVRNGEQIARKYQPVVFNPSTPAQVQTRAKLKLTSQLGAVMSDIIAFRRLGVVSARNQFTKANFKNVEYSENTASFPMEKLDVTGGTLSCNSYATRSEGFINADVFIPSDVNRVVYAFFENGSDNELRLVKKGVVTNNGGSQVVVSLENPGSDKHYLVAYGIRDNSEAARASFGNISVPTTNVNAVLSVVRNLTQSDITLTSTTISAIDATQAQNNDLHTAEESENRVSKKK